MNTRIVRWRNGLALLVPSAFAREARIDEGTPVELTIEGGRLVVAPLSPTYSLDELVSGVTEDNRHDETHWGPAVGADVWYAPRRQSTARQAAYERGHCCGDQSAG